MSQSLALTKAQAPYGRLALLHPLSLSLLGLAVASVALIHLWWLALLAGAGEVLWLVVATSSGAVRRGFDRAHRKERQRELFNTLPEGAQRRALGLRALQRRIEEQAGRQASSDGAFTADLLRPEIDKLDGLIDGFLELAAAIERYDQLLAPQALATLEAERRRYEEQVDRLPAGDGLRETAQKNLALLMQRQQRYAELSQRRDAMRAEMDLAENTLRMIGDEVLGMRSAAELGSRLDELQHGVDSARRAASETDRLLLSTGAR